MTWPNEFRKSVVVMFVIILLLVYQMLNGQRGFLIRKIFSKKAYF